MTTQATMAESVGSITEVTQNHRSERQNEQKLIQPKSKLKD